MKRAKPPLLALDLGDRYIGLARSEAGILAKELTTLDRHNLNDLQIFQKLADYVKKQEIQSLVIGLPLNPNGLENDRCAQIRQFSKNFQSYLEPTYYLLPTTYFSPENFSSFDAQEELKQKRQKNRFQTDHSLAAKKILEQFLENSSLSP